MIEDLLSTFVSKTKEGAYTNERPTTDLRTEAYTIVIDDLAYHSITS